MQLEQALEKLRSNPDQDLATLCELTPAQMDSACGRAQRLMQTGFYDDALKVLNALVLLRPRHARSLRLLGFAYQYHRQPARAYDAFSRAAACDPQDGVAALMAAECALFVLGQKAALPLLEGALAHVRATPANQPYVLRAQRLLALCRVQANTPRSATP